MGPRQSLGLFMRPMTVDAGISAATFGFAIALQNIVWGIAQPFVGALADKYGPRPILIVTALLYAAGLLLMAFWHGAVGINVADLRWSAYNPSEDYRPAGRRHAAEAPSLNEIGL